MIIILFIQILSGFCFFVRVLEHLKASHLFGVKQLTKIGTLYFLWILLGTGIYIESLYLSLIWLNWPIFFLFFLEWAVKRQRERKFCDAFIDLLDSVILQMRVGKAFREAFSSVNQNSPAFFKQVCKDIFEAVVFSQQFKGKIHFKSLLEVIGELTKADQRPHLALQRLVHLKAKLKVEQEFRKKVGQLLLQTRLQAYVLAGLYIALLCFVISVYGFVGNFRIILLSFLFFIIGFVLISFIGRNYKWKL